MRYIVSGEFTKITETSGTIQNTSKINVVEVSDTNEKGSGIMLYPLDRFTFSKSIYARCVDGGGAEVRVVPFEVDTQGGGEQGTTPGGGGSSGIAFAGMILGTESSTVDGGLWFEVVDGLPVVKMNHGGDEFLIDTKPAEDTLIGNKLFLDGHEFKLTGFADGLTFSDNNFYAAGNLVGSVSNYQFQFTDAAALSVAEGGTISITQLDTNAVDYSLNLDSLNGSPTPWNVSDRDSSGYGTYTYTTNTGTGGYNRTGEDGTAYIVKTLNDKQTLTLTLANSLVPDREGTDVNLTQKKWDRKLNTNAPTFTASSFAKYVTVKEIYDSNGTLKSFDITINDNAAIKNGDNWIGQITATAPENVTATIKFGNKTIGYYSHDPGALTLNDDKTTYTFKTDTYIDGYENDSASTDNVTILTKATMPTNASGTDYIVQGDECTIDGLATDLIAVRTDAYQYTLYKKDENGQVTFFEEGDEIPEGSAVGDLKSGMKVGRISYGNIFITSNQAFKELKNGEIATVTDTQGSSTESRKYLGYKIYDELASPTDIAECFIWQDDGSYKYTPGTKPERFTFSNTTDGTDVAKNTGTVSYTAAETIGVAGLDLCITGLPNIGNLIINGHTIQKEDGTTIGSFSHKTRTISLGTFTSGSLLRDMGCSEFAITGSNHYGFFGIYHNGYTGSFWTSYLNNSIYGTIAVGVNTYSVGYALSSDKKTATFHGEGESEKEIHLRVPAGYESYYGGATKCYWRPESNTDASGDILFVEFNGQDWVLNSHAFDGVTTADTINITDDVGSTPINFNIELATDADTLAVSRTFANETFTAGATAGTYTYTATGTTAGWSVSADGSKIASWEFNGKTFTIENLRTDLGTIGFDSQGYIHATNGSTIGRMGGNVIKLYDTAVHKLATPILTGADAADFTLILPT